MGGFGHRTSGTEKTSSVFTCRLTVLYRPCMTKEVKKTCGMIADTPCRPETLTLSGAEAAQREDTGKGRRHAWSPMHHTLYCSFFWDKEMSKSNMEFHHNIVYISLGEGDVQTKSGISLSHCLLVSVTKRCPKQTWNLTIICLHIAGIKRCPNQILNLTIILSAYLWDKKMAKPNMESL
jgi:hypothetical protein